MARQARGPVGRGCALAQLQGLLPGPRRGPTVRRICNTPPPQQRPETPRPQVVEFGRYELDTWYFSPFPEPYASCPKLYICEYSLKYFRKKRSLLRHLAKVGAGVGGFEGGTKAPPGQGRSGRPGPRRAELPYRPCGRGVTANPHPPPFTPTHPPARGAPPAGRRDLPLAAAAAARRGRRRRRRRDGSDRPPDRGVRGGRWGRFGGA
jgi:hypothetical protein